MKKILLSIVLTLAMCLPSFAQELSFSAFHKAAAQPTPIAAKVMAPIADEVLPSYSYNDAVDLATKTGKVIVVCKNVANDKEIQAQCVKKGDLYVNADNDPVFYTGLSKLEFLAGKILYTEMPPSAHPDKPQDRQFIINRDDLRTTPKVATAMYGSGGGRVTVPTQYAEINTNQGFAQQRPMVFNMDGTPYTGQCADGSRCVNGVCTTGTCATGACATGTCGQPQQMQQMMPMQMGSYPMMQGGFQGGFMDGGFGGGFQGGSCGPGG